MLGRVAQRHVADHEAVGAVGLQRHVLLRADRAPLPDSDPAGVDHDVVGRRPRALDLQVAADAGAEVGDAVRVRPAGEARLRILSRAEPAADHGHQALGVRAVVLVGVGHGPGAVVRGLAVLVALRRERRHRARVRLGVGARHDHHAVVVAGRRHGGLDLVVAAAGEEGAVQVEQPPAGRAAQLRQPRRGAQAEAARLGRADVARGGRQRVLPADHARGAAGRAVERRGQRARLRHGPAGGRPDRRVGRRVRPVGGALDVRQRAPATGERRRHRHSHRRGAQPLASLPRRLHTPSPALRPPCQEAPRSGES